VEVEHGDVLVAQTAIPAASVSCERQDACKKIARPDVEDEERWECTSGAATAAVETAGEIGAGVPFEGQNYANKSADVFQGEAEEIQADKCHWTCVDAGRADVEEHEQDQDHKSWGPGLGFWTFLQGDSVAYPHDQLQDFCFFD